VHVQIMFLLLVLCVFHSHSSLGENLLFDQYLEFPVVVSFIICVRSRLKKEIRFRSLIKVFCAYHERARSFVEGAKLDIHYIGLHCKPGKRSFQEVLLSEPGY